MYTSKTFIQLLIITLGILLIPFFGIIFGDDFKWSFFDFLIGGILIHLFITGIYFVFFTKKFSFLQKSAIVIFLFGLILLWADLAVGIFGMPWSGN